MIEGRPSPVKKYLRGYLEHVLDERCQKFVENYMKLKIIDLN
jgi:hypothetical protein